MSLQTLLLLVLVLLYCCSSGAFASAGAGGAVDPHVGGLGMHSHRIDARYWLPVGAPIVTNARMRLRKQCCNGCHGCRRVLLRLAACNRSTDCATSALHDCQVGSCLRHSFCCTCLTSFPPSSWSGACTAASRSAGLLPVGGVLQGIPPPLQQHQRCACVPRHSPSAFSLCSSLKQPCHPQVLAVRQGALIVNHDTCDTNAVNCTAAASAAENGVSEALLPADSASGSLSSGGSDDAGGEETDVFFSDEARTAAGSSAAPSVISEDQVRANSA